MSEDAGAASPEPVTMSAGPTASSGAPATSEEESDEDLLRELQQELGGSSAPDSGQSPSQVRSVATVAKPVSSSGGTIVRAGRLKLLDLSFNSLFAAGGTTAPADRIGDLQSGGHDPKQNGFTVQNLEMTLLGAVDPYFRGSIFLIFQVDEAGESFVEVEEAYLTTQSLPAGLQIKAGTFFTEAGRLNPRHPHTWDFADQPVVNSRMFGGDGLRGPGARISYLMPLPFYSEVSGTVQNARGETAFSFLGAADQEDFSGHPLVDRLVNGPEDLLYTLGWTGSFELSETTTFLLQASGVFGPNRTGPGARTTIAGVSAYLHWRGIPNYQGYPFFKWQTEAFYRNYEVAGSSRGSPVAGRASESGGFGGLSAVDGASEPGGSVEAGEVGEWSGSSLEDVGLYSQVVWGFHRGWVVGTRVDWAGGNGDAGDPLRGARLRFSANLTRYPTEFSKLRLQYNLDRAEFLDNDLQHSVWLQFEFLLGAHGAHKF